MTTDYGHRALTNETRHPPLPTTASIQPWDTGGACSDGIANTQEISVQQTYYCSPEVAMKAGCSQQPRPSSLTTPGILLLNETLPRFLMVYQHGCWTYKIDGITPSTVPQRDVVRILDVWYRIAHTLFTGFSVVTQILKLMYHLHQRFVNL